MKYFSTRNTKLAFSFREAVLAGLAPDGGLFLPQNIPQVAERLSPSSSLVEIGNAIAQAFVEDEIPQHSREEIVQKTLSFPLPLVSLSKNISMLELFHGPTFAFKDFGARFLAGVLGYFSEGEQEPCTVLVATSGDTGGAVAQGFFGVAGTQVLLLYPKGRVSPLQEKQMTTLGGNVRACAIEGSFDDCQRLVKEAFLDKELLQRVRLSSANSINIARLLPQCFYHAFASQKLFSPDKKLIMVVPSGNYGNLCASVLARRMGFPLHAFLAASNANDIVPHYLATGDFSPRTSRRTLSNAMDVGHPSNFERLAALYDQDYTKMSAEIMGISISDEETTRQIKECFAETKRILDPHTAVGLAAIGHALEHEGTQACSDALFCLLATAHPAKFREALQGILPEEVPLPAELLALEEKATQYISLRAKIEDVKEMLLA